MDAGLPWYKHGPIGHLGVAEKMCSQLGRASIPAPNFLVLNIELLPFLMGPAVSFGDLLEGVPVSCW